MFTCCSDSRLADALGQARGLALGLAPLPTPILFTDLGVHAPARVVVGKVVAGDLGAAFEAKAPKLVLDPVAMRRLRAVGQLVDQVALHCRVHHKFKDPRR